MLGAAAISAAALSTVGGAASADGSNEPRPTIVLVHGAFADASGWNDVTRRLQQDDYTVIATANPLRSVDSDAAYLESILDTIDGPIVLVGHSYGGFVMTNAAAGDPDVEALVYVAAFAPAPGDTVEALTGMNPGSGLADPHNLVVRPNAHRRRRIHQPGHVPRHLRRRPAPSRHRRDGCQPATGRSRNPVPAVRPGRLGNHSIVVRGGLRGPHHPAGDAAVHGRTSRSNNDRDPIVTRGDDVAPEASHRRHRERRSRRQLTTSPGRTTVAWGTHLSESSGGVDDGRNLIVDDVLDGRVHGHLGGVDPQSQSRSSVA